MNRKIEHLANKMPCLKLFGKRVKKLRKNAKLTQKELAEQLDVGCSAVTKYERATDAFPSIPALVKLAEIFNVTTDYLLKGIQHTSSVENNISGELNNSPIVQANQSSVILNSQVNTPEAEELLSIYRQLKGRERIKLLDYALNLEEASAK